MARNRYARVEPNNEGLEDKRFYERMAKATEIEVVILAHAYVEYELDQLIAWCLPSQLFLDEAKLEFNQGVALALAFGLDERFKSPLMALAKVRNDFAHRRHAVLDKNTVRNFVKTVDGDSRTMSHQSYARAYLQQHTGRTIAKKLSEASFPDQFLLYAVTLRSALRAARMAVMAHR